MVSNDERAQRVGGGGLRRTWKRLDVSDLEVLDALAAASGSGRLSGSLTRRVHELMADARHADCLRLLHDACPELPALLETMRREMGQ